MRQEPEMVLHGGGNTSVKRRWRTAWGEQIPVIYVKASGWDLAGITPEGCALLDRDYPRRLTHMAAG